MTIEELDAYIKDYTKNDKTNRAVMLTAPWGSGKTYYIKNELVPSLKKDGIGTILVSLYGIESLAELSKNLYIEARAKWINKKSEKREIGKIIAKTIVKNVVGHYGIDLSVDEKDMQKLYESVNLSKRLIILDDLERSRIDIVDVLGFVNDLCEQDGAKVLLVANEKAIKTYEKKESISQDGKKSTDLVMTKECEQYIRIKEKTIGDTITFFENKKNVIKGILENYDNKYFKWFLKEIADSSYNIFAKISDIMDMNMSNNYRSLLYACQKTDDIIRKLSKSDYNFDNDFIENLFLGSVAYLTKDTVGVVWEGDDNTSASLGLVAYPLYRVMYDFVNFQFFNEHSLKAMQELFLRAKMVSELDEYLQKIYSCDTCAEVEIIEAIDKLEEGLEKNILPDSDFIKLANYLIFAKGIIGCEKKIDNCLNLMLSNARTLTEKGNKIATESFSGIQLETKEEWNAFDKFKQELKNISNKRFEVDKNNYSAAGLSAFYDKIIKERASFINYGGFAKHLDIPILLEQIKNSTAEEIQRMRRIFMSVYREFSNINEYYKGDLDNLRALYDGIDKINENPGTLDKVHKKQLQWFSLNLDDVIKRLEQ